MLANICNLISNIFFNLTDISFPGNLTIQDGAQTSQCRLDTTTTAATTAASSGIAKGKMGC